MGFRPIWVVCWVLLVACESAIAPPVDPKRGEPPQLDYLLRDDADALLEIRQKPTGGSGASVVSAWATDTCMIDPEGTPWCWGSSYEQPHPVLGHDDISTDLPVVSAPMPVRHEALRDLDTLAVGLGRVCALRSGNEKPVVCWRANWSDPVNDVRTMGAGITFRSIYAGDRVFCALDALHKTYCWGYTVRPATGRG